MIEVKVEEMVINGKATYFTSIVIFGKKVFSKTIITTNNRCIEDLSTKKDVKHIKGFKNEN